LAPGFGSDELRTLYERYAPLIHRRALCVLAREAEAWDVVQEVFRILLERSPQFRREANPMTYVYRVTTNVALNALRARTFREEHDKDGDTDSGHTPGGAEARSVLRALVRSVDERALRIAALHFMDGLTQEEIGQVLRLSRKTVGIQLEKVRLKAKELSGAHA
jgi:RNA polymerase sigma-70 factor (ECF subfamily)